MAAVGFFFAVLLTSILKSSNLGALAEVAKIKFECQDGQGPICAVDFVDHGIYYLSQKNQDIERVTFDRYCYIPFLFFAAVINLMRGFGIALLNHDFKKNRVGDTKLLYGQLRECHPIK